jgi:hypothetical protein
MRKFTVFAAVLLTAMSTSAFAQNGSSVGTWKYDRAQSDFGTQAKPKSIRLVVTKDTPQMLSWHLTEVDANGKIVKESWSGPEDGSMHPLKATGSKNVSSFKREGDDFVRQEKMGDGGMEESHIAMSDGGNTMTEHVTGTDKDGKQFTATIVWNRVTGKKKATS